MPNMLFKFRLNPGAISLHDDEERKKLLTVLLLTSGMAAGILFLVQDIFAGNLVEVGVDLGLIFLFSAFATLLVKTDHTLVLCRVSVGSLAFALILVTYLNADHGSKFFLLLIFPQVYHTILGNREGGIWSALTLGAVLVVFFLSKDQIGQAPAAFITRFTISYLCILSVAYIQEKIRELYFGRLNREKDDLVALNREIKHLSITDKLTGLFNRTYLDEAIKKEFQNAVAGQKHLSIAICDIDHFKKINDAHGHQAGDKILKEFADILSGSSRRTTDWVARFGGEEFIMVFPETALATAGTVVERIRQRVAATPFAWQGKPIHITASFGVAAMDKGKTCASGTYEQLIRQADKALYQSKADGRNRVRSHNDCLYLSFGPDSQV